MEEKEPKLSSSPALSVVWIFKLRRLIACLKSLWKKPLPEKLKLARSASCKASATDWPSPAGDVTVTFIPLVVPAPALFNSASNFSATVPDTVTWS